MTQITERLYVYSSLSAVHLQEWNRVLGEEGCPFLRYEFLYALEESQCVGEESGWIPYYFCLFEEPKEQDVLTDASTSASLVPHSKERTLIGAVASYKKWNSQGEFIFDWSWADAAQRVGLPYYPKLTLASPFSPVNGPRFLIDPDRSDAQKKRILDTLVDGIRKWGQDHPITGLHCLFISSQEANVLEQKQFLIRHSLQYHWHNQGYRDFQDFLKDFKSKTRNQIKRERKKVYEQGIRVQAYIGDEIQEEHLSLIYFFYTKTVQQFLWGQQYLNFEFFKQLYQNMRDAMCIILAYQGEQVVGGTFNLVSNGVLYGRYWGGLDDEEGRPLVPYLHFEVCSYFGIDLCIQKGWSRFEPGAGGRGHKCKRGFLPQCIYSAHEVYLPGFQHALEDFLTEEKGWVAQEITELEGTILRCRTSTEKPPE